MTNIKIEKRNVSFNDAKSKFSNDRIQTDCSSNESINTLDKKFKHEVKQPSFVHTTTRKNYVGNGLNELSAKKKANSAIPKHNVMEEKDELEIIKVLGTLNKKQKEALGFYPKQSDGKRVQNQSLSEQDTFPELPACAYKPALFPKPSKEKIREALDRVRNNSEARSSASVQGSSPFNHNPIYQGKKRVSSDRFKPKHPSQQIDQSDFTKPAESYSNLVRCSNTHSGETLEPKMERKHKFQSDPSVKHIKVDTAVCSITKVNNNKAINRPNASHKQEPLSEVSKVNVKGLANSMVK